MELKEKVTRREFLKRALAIGGAIAIGTFSFKRYFGHRKIENYVDTLNLPKREARYYYGFGDDMVRCEVCPNMCILKNGEWGLCRSRQNINGKLYSRVYGIPCAVHLDPIEKKPVFHFYPGSKAYSISTTGCNLRCKFCQNWQISQVKPNQVNYINLPPSSVVANAKMSGATSIAYTYGEPVAFYDYMLDTATLAKSQGVKNVVITAGYINEEPLKELAKVVDVIKVDLKGFNREYYRKICSAERDEVLNALKVMKKTGVWIEIVNLILPTLNDAKSEIESMSEWILDNLGKDVPLHFSRFFPMYKLKNLPPTPVETLEMARKTAIDVGLNYVYIGNVPGHYGEDTYCPNCGNVLVDRNGYFIRAIHIKNGRCEYCGYKIAGVWK